MSETCGMKNWVFSDGDLPPAGDKDPKGHEALMITNVTTANAKISIDILFEDKDPKKGITLELGGERVVCIRLDQPIGVQGYSIPKGQYSLVLHSDVPVVAVFGRLDVRQPNLAYYSVQGYGY